MLSIPLVIVVSLTAAWLAVEMGDPTILLGWYDIIVVNPDSETNPWHELVRALRNWVSSYE